MSDETERKFVKKIQQKLNNTDQKIQRALRHGITDKVYGSLMEKHNILSDATNVVEDKFHKAMFTSMLECNSIQTQLYKTKQELEEQIAQIITRLEVLEQKKSN